MARLSHEYSVVQGGRPTILPAGALTESDLRWLSGKMPGRLQILAHEKGGFEVRTRGLAGTIQLSSTRLEILPKIQPDRWRTALFHMLMWTATDRRTVHFFQRPADFATTASVFYSMVRLFLDGVDELISAGLIRRYNEREGFITTMRGRLVVRELCRIRFDARLPCRWQELAVDVPDNQLIRTALDQLCTLRLPSRLASRVAGVTAIFEGIQPCPSETPFTYSRLNERYRPTHDLCRLILSDLWTAFGTGTSPFSSFLVDMERLFERYVASLIRRSFSATWQVRAQTTRTLKGEPDNRIRSLTVKPDILLRRRDDGRPALVVDTKYRVPVSVSPRGNESIWASDFYQIFTYASLYSCPGVLVYPQHEAVGRAVGDVFRIGGQTIHLLTIDLFGEPTMSGEGLIAALKDLPKGGL